MYNDVDGNPGGFYDNVKTRDCLFKKEILDKNAFYHYYIFIIINWEIKNKKICNVIK